MDHFQYQHGTLFAEGVAIADLATKVGTPFYCYSSATLTRHYEVLASEFSGLDFKICYAMKANSNLAVLKTLAACGSGADVVSEGEIRRALAAGIAPSDIVFSGVGKTANEIRFALAKDIFQFNVESEPELLMLSKIAQEMGKTARIAIRVNPDVDAQTHAKISTGKKENKFGIAIAFAPALYAQAAALPAISVQGVSVHIGSQLTSITPFREAFMKLRALVETLRACGIPIATVDVGGGLGIPYVKGDAEPPLPNDYARTVREIFDGIQATLILEPGRLLVGNAGILVTEVIYVKPTETRQFVIVDAAMNDLLRPSLYGAHHDIVHVVEHETDNKEILVDIVGPVCESGDTFAEQRKLHLPKAGDLLAFRTAGAYGAVMASTYNTRPLTPEVMVHGKEFAIIRPRQTYDELLAQDKLPQWL